MLKRICSKIKYQRDFCEQKLKKNIIKNVARFEDTLLHQAERPSNYFFQLFHTYLGLADKEESNLCPNVVRNTPDLNTVESICKIEQVHLHTCLGNSKFL